MAKSECVLNILCHRLDDDPVPALYVGPTRSNVEKVIEPRLVAALKSSKRLWSTLARTKMGKTAKRISGVLVRLGWAGSATELASQEAGLAILDEIDRMGLDVEGEGSPIELVDARLATFVDSKMVQIGRAHV
jgi:phage terminase large subunit GpA-like protein